MWREGALINFVISIISERGGSDLASYLRFVCRLPYNAAIQLQHSIGLRSRVPEFAKTKTVCILPKKWP